MIIYIAWYLTRMLYSERDNKIVLKILDPRGNLHFIGWKRFEAVCCRRLKRMAIKREIEVWIKMRFVIFPFDPRNGNWLYCIITSYDFPSACLKSGAVNVRMLKNSGQNVKLFFLRISISCRHLVIRNIIKLYHLCIIKYHTP